LKRLLGRLPAPEKEPNQIAAYVYSELARICAENHARLAVVIITDPGLARKPSWSELEILRALTQVTLVNTEPALLAALPEKTKAAYDAAYRTYRGDPPRLMDPHPNARAHRILADEIVRRLAGSD